MSEENLEVLDRVHAFVRIVDEREFPDHTLTSAIASFTCSISMPCSFHFDRHAGRRLLAIWAGRSKGIAESTRQPGERAALLFETPGRSRTRRLFQLAAQNAAKLFAAREA